MHINRNILKYSLIYSWKKKMFVNKNSYILIYHHRSIKKYKFCLSYRAPYKLLIYLFP